MRVCLIAGKHSAASIVLPHLWRLHPDMDPGAFVCAQVHPIFHLNPDFILPRGLSWNDYPFSGPPAYRPFRFGWDGRDEARGQGTRSQGLWFGAAMETVREPGEEAETRWVKEPLPADPQAEAIRRLRSADVVYAAVDPECADWLALDRCLGRLGLPAGADVRIPWINDLHEDRVAAALASPYRPGDVRYGEMLAAARIRRRFDYGYLANALAVHGRTLRRAGGAADAPVPSKHGLQALYDIRALGPETEGRLLNRMQAWRGTGRYPRDEANRWVGVGSPASRHDILRDLRRAGLVAPYDARRIAVTDLGLRFLDMLHPDSEDRDLPFRLHAWTFLPEAVAGPKVDRYLRTFFGKQVRYLARQPDIAPVKDGPPWIDGDAFVGR